ncbi:MAG: DUF4339 domain-containing protein [Phycisphaerales bacterium]
MYSWYLQEQTASGPVQSGPYTRMQLAAMHAAGTLKPDTLVCRVGQLEWSPAGSDPQLAGIFAGVAEPPPLGDPPVGAGSSVGGALPPYSFAAALEMGWQGFVRNWGVMVLVVLILAVLSAVLQFPSQIGQILLTVASKPGHSSPDHLNPALAALSLPFVCCGVLLAFMLGTPLAVGATYAGVAAARGKASVSDLFMGFRRFPGVLGTALVKGLVGLVVFVPCALPAVIGAILSSRGGFPVPLLIGLMITIPLVLAVTAALFVFIAFPLVAVVDPQMRARGGFPAFSLAWQMGRNWNSPSAFLLSICMGLVAAASVLACCVGYILLGVPLLMCTLGAAYHLMSAPILAGPPGDPRRLP